MAVNSDGSFLRKYAENRSINMCSLMIRVDGDELEIPLNFGMTSEEICQLYPFILQFASVKMASPYVQFTRDMKDGVYKDDEDRLAAKERSIEQSKYWYGKPEASLMDLAVRFALDIRLKGIQELVEVFDGKKAEQNVAKRRDVKNVSNEEIDDYISKMNLDDSDDAQYGNIDEQDIPLGIAGNLTVDIYGTGDDSNVYVSEKHDRMVVVQDDFSDLPDFGSDLETGSDVHNDDASGSDGDMIVDIYGGDVDSFGDDFSGRVDDDIPDDEYIILDDELGDDMEDDE